MPWPKFEILPKLLDFGFISISPKLLDSGIISALPDVFVQRGIFARHPSLAGVALVRWAGAPKLLDAAARPCRFSRARARATPTKNLNTTRPCAHHHEIFHHAQTARGASPSVAAGQACSSTNGEGIYPNFNQASGGLTLNSS